MKTSTLLYAGRGIPKEPVAFQAVLPLKLKHRVSGKSDKTSSVCCMYEMSVLFACFKNNDFNQTPCLKEMEAFQKCYLQHLSNVEVRKEREAKGILTPGEKKLSHKQINILLEQFPNFK